MKSSTFSPVIWSLVTFREIFSKIAGSGPDGSNDTSLKFVSRPGAEPIESQAHTQTQNTDIII